MKTFCLILFAFAWVEGMAQATSGRYELVNLGKEVNTFYHEAAPVVSPDGQTLYFFVQNHPDNTYGKEGSQDIWITRQNSEGQWQAPERLKAPCNQNRSNQVFNVLHDGTLFIRGGRGKNQKGFSLVSPNGQVTPVVVKDFDAMEKGRFYGATISADGRHMILYFSELAASIRSDLYVSHKQADGTWSRPQKLKFTDKSDEFGCFIAPDNKTLYFASDRNAPGRQGGSDIYSATRLDETWNNWSEPVNLGRPVNTAAGEAYFSMDDQGKIYTSRANSRVDGGNLDLYVMVPRELHIKLNGDVVNDNSGEPIEAVVKIVAAGESIATLRSGADGKFTHDIPERAPMQVEASADNYTPAMQTVPLNGLNTDTTLFVTLRLKPMAQHVLLSGRLLDAKTSEAVTGNIVVKPGSHSTQAWKISGGDRYESPVVETGWYFIAASAPGHLNATDSVYVDTRQQTSVTKDILLPKIEVGVTVRIPNIYFDFDRTTIKPVSFAELDKVVDLLQRNNGLEIEIAGHTDSKGADEYNMNLSQGRSEAVVEYLVSKGVARTRLQARGYGETKPIDTNETEAGQANNRRVEFTVLKN